MTESDGFRHAGSRRTERDLLPSSRSRASCAGAIGQTAKNSGAATGRQQRRAHRATSLTDGVCCRDRYEDDGERKQMRPVGLLLPLEGCFR